METMDWIQYKHNKIKQCRLLTHELGVLPLTKPTFWKFTENSLTQAPNENIYAAR